MHSDSRRFVQVCSGLLLFCAPLIAQGSPKTARSATNRALANTTFIAKVDLRAHAKHHVRPDGSPILEGRKGRRQGRGAVEALRPGTSGIKVRAGERGQKIVVRGGGDQLTVSVNKGRSLVNPVNFIIRYDREIVASDITPQKMALALSSLIEIDGFPVGQEVADAFDEVLDEQQPESSRDSAVATPAKDRGAGLDSLEVSALPVSLRAGEELRLRLDYRVATRDGGDAEMTESRWLLLDGSPLPNFPRVDQLERSTGSTTSDFIQRIPSGAEPGEYAFRGEVCFEGDCMSRTVRFYIVQ